MAMAKITIRFGSLLSFRTQPTSSWLSSNTSLALRHSRSWIPLFFSTSYDWVQVVLWRFDKWYVLCGLSRCLTERCDAEKEAGLVINITRQFACAPHQRTTNDCDPSPGKQLHVALFGAKALFSCTPCALRSHRSSGAHLRCCSLRCQHVCLLFTFSHVAHNNGIHPSALSLLPQISHLTYCWNKYQLYWWLF